MMTDVLRVHGGIRQSKTRDRAVSPAAQRAAIQRWADERGYTVVSWSEDLSRSGKFSAFVRPELGPYLTDPLLIGTWDILVTTKIDRACRNTKDFLTIMDWCKANGKTYVSLKEQIDMTTAQGRENARQAAARAEWERDMASERRLETLQELEAEGRWPGGKVPFGLRAEERAEGFFLVPDTGGTLEIANKIADMAIVGKSNEAIMRWLNAEGILNTAGNPWISDRVRTVLHSDSMRLVIGDDKYAQLKLALHSRRHDNSSRAYGQHILLRVSFCSICGSPHYAAKQKRRSGYYRCVPCKYRLRYYDLEDRVLGSLVLVAGDELMHHKVVEMGDQRTAERYDLIRQIDTLKEITDIDVSGPIAALEAKLRDITNSIAPGTERWEPVVPNVTIAQHIETLDRPELGDFLRSAKIRVDAKPGHFRFRITEAGIIQATDLVGDQLV